MQAAHSVLAASFASLTILRLFKGKAGAVAADQLLAAIIPSSRSEIPELHYRCDI